MLDLTDFIKEYVAQLHREKEAIIRVICEQIVAQTLYSEVSSDQESKLLESRDIDYNEETWVLKGDVYRFFFKEDKPYSVNLYDRTKYEKPD